jgi:hypothetical protein
MEYDFNKGNLHYQVHFILCVFRNVHTQSDFGLKCDFLYFGLMLTEYPPAYALH